MISRIALSISSVWRARTIARNDSPIYFSASTKTPAALDIPRLLAELGRAGRKHQVEQKPQRTEREAEQEHQPQPRSLDRTTTAVPIDPASNEQIAGEIVKPGPIGAERCANELHDGVEAGRPRSSD